MESRGGSWESHKSGNRNQKSVVRELPEWAFAAKCITSECPVVQELIAGQTCGKPTTRPPACWLRRNLPIF